MSAYKGASKELRQLYRQLEVLGCDLSLTKRNHIYVKYPDGRRHPYPLTTTNSHVLNRLRLEVRRLAEKQNAGPTPRTPNRAG